MQKTDYSAAASFIAFSNDNEFVKGTSVAKSQLITPRKLCWRA